MLNHLWDCQRSHQSPQGHLPLANVLWSIVQSSEMFDWIICTLLSPIHVYKSIIQTTELFVAGTESISMMSFQSKSNLHFTTNIWLIFFKHCHCRKNNEPTSSQGWGSIFTPVFSERMMARHRTKLTQLFCYDVDARCLVTTLDRCRIIALYSS